MPDYVPPIHLPTGLAEQTGQIAAQRAQIIPQAINQGIQSIISGLVQSQDRKRQEQMRQQQLAEAEQLRQKQLAEQTLSPMQIAALTGQPMPIQSGPGANAIVPGMAEAFPRGLPPVAQPFIMEKEKTKQMMAGIEARGKEQEEAARVRGEESRKLAEEKSKLGMIPLTPEEAKRFGLPAGTTEVHREKFQAYSKAVLAGGSTEELMPFARDLAEGRAAPSQMSQVLGRGGPMMRLRVFNMAKQINPEFNQWDAEQEYQRGISGARAGGKSAQTLGGLIRGVENNIDAAIPLLEKLSPSQLRAINEVYRKAEAQINDPDVAALYTHIRSIISQQAGIYKGGTASPTEVEIKAAEEAIGKGITAGSLRGVKSALEVENFARLSGALATTKEISAQTKALGEKMSGKSDGTQESLDDLLKKHGGQ